MTQDEREELARAMARADGHEIVAAIDRFRPDDDFQPPQVTIALALSMYAETLDAIAPIIERLVAERVAAETGRCAGIADDANAAWAALLQAAGTEGERRATAAIVAWLGDTANIHGPHLYLADAIERGDHLTAHKPLDT